MISKTDIAAAEHQSLENLDWRVERAHQLREQATRSYLAASGPIVQHMAEIESAMPKTFEVHPDKSLTLIPRHEWPQWAVNAMTQGEQSLEWLKAQCFKEYYEFLARHRR